MINVKNPDFFDTPASKKRAVYPYHPLADVPSVSVSILTPFYNTDEVFLETTQSVFNQSFQEWEWIIVDDGSTDPASIERLAKVKQRDVRVRIIRRENSGPGAARNVAFKASQGRYICLLDSDDLLEPTFLEKTVWFLESQTEFAFCNSWSVNFGDREFLWTNGFERGKDHLKANSGPPISLIRREAFQAGGGFNEEIKFGHEDWDFWLSLANAGLWGFTLPEYLEWYRLRDSGRFSQVMKDRSVHHEFENYIKKKYGGLEGRFPTPQLRQSQPFESVPLAVPFENRLLKSAKKRILFLIPWMITGGADKVNLDLMKGLTDRGYDVSVCATLRSHHNWFSEFTKLTPDVFILPHFLHLSDFPRFIMYLIKSRQIDTVLISGSTIGYQLLPYLRAQCAGVSFVDLCHVEELQWWNGGHPRFGVGYQEMLDLNIVTTGHLCDWMVGRGAERSRIEICYTGVDAVAIDTVSRQRKAIRAKLGIEDNMPVILYAGRICPQKRPHLFAEILRDLSRKGIAFRCFIIGEGELLPDLEKLMRNYSLESSVQMMGTIDHSRWLEMLAAADIFLLPSEYEGISVALYESMAMRHVVPVMADVGGQSEIITSECGYLIPRGENELNEYVAALSFLIHNPEKRMLMAQAGYERISQQFTLDGCISRFLDLLEHAHVLSQTRPRQAVSAGLAKELATLAVEYSRINSVAELLWVQAAPGNRGVQISPSLVGLVELMTLFGNTRIGKAMLNSKRIVAFGQWLLKKWQAGRQP